jgi:hypothetical protein
VPHAAPLSAALPPARRVLPPCDDLSALAADSDADDALL